MINIVNVLYYKSDFVYDLQVKTDFYFDLACPIAYVVLYFLLMSCSYFIGVYNVSISFINNYALIVHSRVRAQMTQLDAPHAVNLIFS